MEKKIQNKVVDKKRSAGDYKLLKSPTGIKGFDDITFGGLPLNRPTLLVGSIGSGKTFLAMEYIINGIEMFTSPGFS
jgi:circadian clock protein KaiC